MKQLVVLLVSTILFLFAMNSPAFAQVGGRMGENPPTPTPAFGAALALVTLAGAYLRRRS